MTSHKSRHHRKRHHRSGAGFLDYVYKGVDMAKKHVLPHVTADNLRKGIDMGKSYVPDKYKKYADYADKGAQAWKHLGGARPRRPRAPTPYNALVKSVAKEKFAGQRDAMTKASAYIKANGLYKGGKYVSGKGAIY